MKIESMQRSSQAHYYTSVCAVGRKVASILVMCTVQNAYIAYLIVVHS